MSGEWTMGSHRCCCCARPGHRRSDTLRHRNRATTLVSKTGMPWVSHRAQCHTQAHPGGQRSPPRRGLPLQGALHCRCLPQLRSRASLPCHGSAGGACRYSRHWAPLCPRCGAWRARRGTRSVAPCRPTRPDSTGRSPSPPAGPPPTRLPCSRCGCAYSFSNKCAQYYAKLLLMINEN